MSINNCRRTQNQLIRRSSPKTKSTPCSILTQLKFLAAKTTAPPVSYAISCLRSLSCRVCGHLVGITHTNDSIEFIGQNPNNSIESLATTTIATTQTKFRCPARRFRISYSPQLRKQLRWLLCLSRKRWEKAFSCLRLKQIPPQLGKRSNQS